ncbi:MAG: hypothetical protein ACI32N_03920 [Bulleidia sp.]
MKKRLTHALCALALLSGCTMKSLPTDQYNTKMDEYETYYTEVISNGRYEEDSPYFSLHYEMTQVEDGTYRYYVILDDPQIAMYNIMMITVENGVAYEDCDQMMPSFGIFEDRVSMIPGQVNRQDGFVKGITISGECDQNQIDLLLLVRWKSSSGDAMSAYITESLQYEPPVEEQP